MVFLKLKPKKEKAAGCSPGMYHPKSPQVIFLDKAKQENEQLKLQLEKANKKIDNYSSELLTENNELKNTVTILSEKIKALTNEQDMLHEEMSLQAKNLAKYEFADKYNINLIILVFFLVSFALGFVFALRWIRRQESKRLSGYKLAHK